MSLLHSLLSASAAAHPDRVAVSDRGRRITYAELEAEANRLAGLLGEAGVARGDRVGLYLEKSLESVIGLYAVMKAGAAYVPLDASSPLSRLGYIAGDAGLRCLLTGTEKAAEWEGLLAAGAPCETLVVLNAAEPPEEAAGLSARVLGTSAFAGRPDAVPDAGTEADDLAYILYTSGSTGVPKGVMLSHRNALTFIDWAVEHYTVGAEDRLSNHAPLHFDLSTFDLFAAASAGAEVALVPPELSIFPVRVARFIAENRITVWYSVPSLLTLLVLRGNLQRGAFPDLRVVLFAGEVFPPKHLAPLMDLLPHVRFANLYGPTETNVCTYYDVPRLPDPPPASIPIGRAIGGIEVFAVGEDDADVPRGQVGELCVRGPSVMRGYWGDPERTARGMRPVASRGDAEPLYRTGDLVTEDEHGDFMYLGRRDGQVKRLGYRIELAEIEAAIDAHPAVVESAVVAAPDERLTTAITAYVAVSDPALDAPALAEACLRRLPKYMIPDTFEVRDELPRTSTGKIDRKRLGQEQVAGRS